LLDRRNLKGYLQVFEDARASARTTTGATGQQAGVSMSITIQCQCSRVITVSEELAGQPTRCPSCGRRHLIPQVRREARKADLSGRVCRDCRVELVKGAEFCHVCGLPAATPKSVVQPADAPVAPAAVPQAPQPQIHVQHITVPVPMPHGHGPVQAMPPQMAGPWGCCRKSRAAQAAHAGQGPFAAAMKPEKPVSGLAKVSMTCAYISILLSMFTVLAAIPMAGHLYRGMPLEPVQARSLIVLIQGMAGLIGLFSFVGVLTGFLGLFHFGRKRAGAVLGIVLSIVVGMAALRSVHHMKDRYNAIHHNHQPQTTDMRSIDNDGCCPRNHQMNEPNQEQQDQRTGGSEEEADF
jgi:hypothetical protein